MKDPFAETLKKETLKNIFIYFTETASGDEENGNSPGLNKNCIKCGKEKAQRCGKNSYTALFDTCSTFRGFIESEEQ